MDERIDGAAHAPSAAARGAEQMDVLSPRFAASVHVQSPAQTTKLH